MAIENIDDAKPALDDEQQKRAAAREDSDRARGKQEVKTVTPEAPVVADAPDDASSVPVADAVSPEPLPEQTDNSERPEDGVQDVSQNPDDAPNDTSDGKS